MKPVLNHSWDLSEQEALALQQKLSSKIIKHDDLNKIKLIAGVDVAYSKETDQLVSAVVVLDAFSLEVIETVLSYDRSKFPYISGLFSFREIPALISAFDKLKNIPDLVVCDGQGYAHPRRFGLACHLGLIFDIPTIGCGKTKLIGQHEKINLKKGSTTSLKDKNEIIGNLLRTQDNINPIYVSIGHRISLATACDWVLKLSPLYRLPQTTRLADQAVRLALAE